MSHRGAELPPPLCGLLITVFLCLHKALGQMLYLEAKTSGKQVCAGAHRLLPKALCCCAGPQLQGQ